jgi:hypothetical protein
VAPDAIPFLEVALRPDLHLVESKDVGWKETTNDVALEVYRDYRANSTHFRSIRPYHMEGDNGPDSPNEGFLKLSDYDDYRPKFTPIKELK